MINLRYHIISITAVFLALGIGLTLGSSFLDRVTVDTLESQLTEVEHQVRETRTDNELLRDTVSRIEAREAALRTELPERLLAGRLEALPVLVLATEGTDAERVAATIRVLGGAGAEVAGTWWLTERWALEGDEDRSDLAAVLDLGTRDVPRLRRNSAIRVADLLTSAAGGPVADGEAGADEVPVPLPEPSEPALVAALVEAGFLRYEPLPGSAEGRVLLPAAGVRYVVVSGSQPGAGPQAFALSLLDEMAAESAAPVVAAQGRVGLPADGNRPASEDASRTTFVGPIRDGELTRSRITTVDALDVTAGLVALVLSLEDLGAGVVGHYGVAPGAVRLLPAPAVP